jgi:hypothetical protein
MPQSITEVGTMRTDPRAAEVRSIVKQAFACFLGENGAKELAAAPPASRHAGRYGNYPNAAEPLRGRPDAPRRPAFPRIYDPAADASSANIAVDAPDAPPTSDASGAPPSLEIDETVLIDRGRCVARSYRAAGYMAMWLVAVGIVQFYDSCGQMLGTVNLFETLRPKRLVA